MTDRSKHSDAERFAPQAGWGSPTALRAALVAFVILVAVTGGSARADTLSLAVLRPAAVAFGAYALLWAPLGSGGVVRGWLALIALVAVTIAAHLIPLPPALWHALPGREPIVAVDALLGLGDLWRPLALAPAGAWNALLSLLVPLAGLLLFAGLQPQHRTIVLDLWIALALVSALWGLAQLVGGGALYAYGTTNRAMPVGMLANANHQAVFLAATLPLLAFRATRSTGQEIAGIAATTGAMLLLAIVILLTGSRAGIAIGFFCLLLALFVLARHLKFAGADKAKPEHASGGSRVSIGAMVGAVVLLVVGGGFALLIASQGFVGLVAPESGPELRIAALPTIFAMLERGWTVGYGAGSFPAAFQTFEPTSMLSRYYLNHAHNDWIEPILDFGIAGALLMVVFLILVARACRQVLSVDGMALSRRLCLIAPVFAFAVASVVDYPLRVPIIQVMALVWLSALGSGEILRSRRKGRR